MSLDKPPGFAPVNRLKSVGSRIRSSRIVKLHSGGSKDPDRQSKLSAGTPEISPAIGCVTVMAYFPAPFIFVRIASISPALNARTVVV